MDFRKKKFLPNVSNRVTVQNITNTTKLNSLFGRRERSIINLFRNIFFLTDLFSGQGGWFYANCNGHSTKLVV